MGGAKKRVATGRHGLEDILSESWMNDKERAIDLGICNAQHILHAPTMDGHHRWMNRALKQHDAALAVSDATGCQAMIA